MQQRTRLNGAEDTWVDRPWRQTVQPGDRIQVDGFRLDDGRLLALQIEITDRAFVPGSLVVRSVTFGVSLSPGGLTSS